MHEGWHPCFQNIFFPEVVLNSWNSSIAFFYEYFKPFFVRSSWIITYFLSTVPYNKKFSKRWNYVHKREREREREWKIQSENTHHRGKDDFTAGLEFKWFVFDPTRKYVVICTHWNYRIQTSQTGDKKVSVILHTYSECSLEEFSSKNPMV